MESMMPNWVGPLLALMTEAEIDAALAKLERLGHDQSGWETLYRDPGTGSFWEITYPQSRMHGGGPRQLSEIAPSWRFDEKAKYFILLVGGERFELPTLSV
jgi:hypothetical protein